MDKKIGIIIMSLLFFVIFIPATSASDFDNETLSQNNDLDILTANNEIYFNASVENDGDGTITSPYKYVTSSRITSNSILHFANGEYKLSNSKNIYTMTMIGEDVEKTIFKGNGDLFTVSGTLTLQNMTFVTSTLTNHGTIRANNVIFDGGVADDYDEYGNSFGGTIFNDGDYYYPSIYLTNCTVKNSYAVYGGAIYLAGGTASIADSVFYNNSAFNYGGAIACENTASLTVEGSLFDSDYSINDAGGAIYSVDSALNIKDSEFRDCTATFGGAICDLTSKTTIVNMTGKSNRAKYEGGAVYKMYGSISIVNSNFNENVAKNGGALFIDNTTSFMLTRSKFTSNIAYLCAGAYYSFLNNNSVVSGNTFEKNRAIVYSNYYETDKLNLNIGSGDYTQFIYDDSNYDGVLPAKFDLRDYGWVTPVKDQETSGNCWAFSAIAALESCILKASNNSYDLSEENVKNLIEWYSDYGWNSETNEGGINEMAIGYLTSWLGPVFEDEDLFDDYSVLSPVLNSLMHVQNVIFLTKNDYTDNDAIKEALIRYGAVSTTLYYSSTYLNSRTKGYYYDGNDYSNHAVTIVGWDDTYSRFKFRDTPDGDGAWIVKNSWNEEWGDNGYFYVSYYDSTFAEVGTSNGAYTFILNDTIHFDKNYQYDIIGLTDYFITGKSTIWYENLFNATGNELLMAFSTYFNTTTSWEAYIYVNDDLKLTQNGVSNPGYYTINLDEYVPVKTGDVFKIALKISASKYASFPVCEDARQNKISYMPGVSFFSYNGKTWYDLYNYSLTGYDHYYTSQVACIKAFTVIGELSSTINLIDFANESEVQKDINILALIYDQYNNLVSDGKVIVSYDNQQKTVDLVEGCLNTTVAFNNVGNYTVFLDYFSEYYSASNATFNVSISKSDVYLDISINNISYAEDLIADINLRNLNLEEISEDLLLVIDNRTYTVKSNQKFNIPDILNAGNYTTIISFNGSDRFYSKINSTNFTITPQKLDINLTVIQDFDNVLLILNTSKDMTVPVLVNNETYNVECVKATGSLNLTDLDLGKYLVNVSVNIANYLPVSILDTFNVSSVDTQLNASDIVMYYHDGTRFNVNLSDIEGNLLLNKSLVISVNGINYTRITDENGTASIGLNLDSGNYTIDVFYLGEKKYNPSNITSSVNILPTIISSDLVKYYRNASQYYALILDYEGNPLADTNVSMNINGVFYNRTTNASGVVRLNINLPAGKYVITVSNPVTGQMMSNNITVISRLIENNDIVKYYRNATQYTLKVVDDTGTPLAGRTVKFNINGVFYYRVTNASGYVQLNINLQPGDYIITAEYNECRVSNNVTVLSKIESEDMEMNFSDKSQFTVRILDDLGNPYPNGEVTFNINGVFYTRISDDNGFARLNINLMSGEYIITSTYDELSVSNTITIH